MKRALLSKTRLCVMAAAVVVLAGLLAGGVSAGDQADANKTVRLVIDYNDGVERHFVALPWKAGLTVFQAMELARTHPRGITFEYKDYGGQVGYLITRIDDLENQGGGREARNWIYRVSDVQAKKACNKYELKAGDVVRWKFEVWQ